MYEMSQHPDVLAKLQQEVDSILQGSVPTSESIAKMKYMTMVINETLRLHPVAPVVRRQAMSDITIHGYSVPKGVYFSALLAFFSLPLYRAVFLY